MECPYNFAERLAAEHSVAVHSGIDTHVRDKNVIVIGGCGHCAVYEPVELLIGIAYALQSHFSVYNAVFIKWAAAVHSVENYYSCSFFLKIVIIIF